MPLDQRALDGWRASSDEAGALREEHSFSRHDSALEVDDRAVLLREHDDEDYLRNGATTHDDLEALAPKVPERVRDAIPDADPTLDDDLAIWWNEDCPLPRLTLLGPVGARTRGTPVTKRKPYYTEMLAYLATRAPSATLSWPTPSRSLPPRPATTCAAFTTGSAPTPRTGDPHLPDARKAPAAIARGVGVYQVLDLLIDADLFRRLRVRGESGGPDALEDLRKALELVQGRPFDRLRDGGWSFLSEGDRLDQHMICAIVDWRTSSPPTPSRPEYPSSPAGGRDGGPRGPERGDPQAGPRCRRRGTPRRGRSNPAGRGVQPHRRRGRPARRLGPNQTSHRHA